MADERSLPEILEKVPLWLGAFAAALAGLFGALGAGWAAFRAKRTTEAAVEEKEAAARKLEAEADETGVRTRKHLFEEVEHLRGVALKATGEAYRWETSCREWEAKCKQLEARLEVLEKLVPMAFAAKLLKNLGLLKLVMEKMTDPLVLSSSVGGGTFLWANKAFCDALGRPLEEILALGWRGLCHPGDLKATVGAESTAWDEPVDDFVNRFYRSDGAIVWLRWVCYPYDEGGVTLARVEVARVDPPQGATL
jgi:PAS domain-containing protein